MTMTDPIADMLTRIRNAVRNRSMSVTMPASRLKVEIARVLKEEGYITGYSAADDGPRAILDIELKYGEEGEEVITDIQRYSKPGCRRYRTVNDLPQVLDGLGIAILTTNKGVMSDRQCREQNVGGEVLCTVY
jgi:small subunit ribosomal protein S8